MFLLYFLLIIINSLVIVNDKFRRQNTDGETIVCHILVTFAAIAFSHFVFIFYRNKYKTSAKTKLFAGENYKVKNNSKLTPLSLANTKKKTNSDIKKIEENVEEPDYVIEREREVIIEFAETSNGSTSVGF